MSTLSPSPRSGSKATIRTAEPNDGIAMWRLRRDSGLSPFEYVGLLFTKGALSLVMEEDGMMVGFVLAVVYDDTLRLVDAVAPTGAELADMLGRVLDDERCQDTSWIEASWFCQERAAQVLRDLRGVALAKSPTRRGNSHDEAVSAAV